MKKNLFVRTLNLAIYLLINFFLATFVEAQDTTHIFLGKWDKDSIQFITSDKDYVYFITKDAKLHVADQSNPLNPQIISSLDLTVVPSSIKIKDDIIMLLTKINDYRNSLVFIDVSDKTKPEIKGEYKSDPIYDVIKYQDYYILSVQFALEPVILDGSDLSNVVKINDVGWTADFELRTLLQIDTLLIAQMKGFQHIDANVFRYTLSKLPNSIPRLGGWGYDDGSISHIAANDQYVFVTGSNIHVDGNLHIHSLFYLENDRNIWLENNNNTTKSFADKEYLYLLSANPMLAVYNINDVDSVYNTFTFLEQGQSAKDISLNGDIIYVLSNSGIVFVFKRLIATKLEERELISPFSFLLYNNYPNPFNSNTKISYEIYINSNIALYLYDINGKKVKTLFSGRMMAGKHEYTLNMDDFSSGIYYYQLRSNNRSITKKLILIK